MNPCDHRFPGAKILRGAVLFVVLFGFLAAQPAIGQTTLVGTVTNAATRQALAGARVIVRGTERETLTDSEGVYRFNDLQPGPINLSFSYTGLTSVELPVEIRSGVSNRLDAELTSEIYQLSQFVVAGEREGNALAVTQQRQAPNVKNVVSADAFGSLSGNPAELLERITGVVVERVGGDPRFISIRGIPGELNSIQVDGNRTATSNLSRGTNFESVGSDHVEAMELIKSPTPDMDADAIGGTVNIRSRSAFALKERRFSYTLGGIIGYKRYPHGPLPFPSFSYSDVLDAFGGKDNLGITLSGSFRQHLAAMDFVNPINYQATNDSPAFMRSLAYDGRMNLRTRWGGGLKLDYKLSDRHAVYLNMTYSPHSENSVVPVTTVATAANGSAVVPGYTDNRTEVRPVVGNTVSLSNLHRERKARAYSVNVGGRISTPDHELDYDVSHSANRNNQFLHTVTMSLAGVGFILDRTGTSRWTPTLTYTGGPDPTDLNLYRNNLLTNTVTPSQGRIYGAKINYRKNFAVGVPAYLKTGLRLRVEQVENWDNSRRWRYAGPDGILNNGDEQLAQFRDLNLDYHPMHGVYPAGPIPSPDAMRNHKNDNPGLWQEDVAFGSMAPLAGHQELEEQVSAGYLMGNVALGRLSILGGLRVEQTKVEGEGPLDFISAEERARRAAFVGPLTEAEIVRRNAAQYGNRRSTSRDYRDVFPGIHFKYALRERLVLRASYAASIGRPAFTSIVPEDNIDEENQVVDVNNTGLLPQFSDNFDATAEYYFEPAGLLSFGVFLKEIKNFIYNTAGQTISAGPDNGFGGEYAGYELRSQANGGFARLKGWEASYQQQFTFLPGGWSGFGAFANYTWLDTKGDYGNIGTVQTTNSLPNFTPRAANVGVSYIRGRVSLRFMYGMNGRTLVAFNAQDHLKRYRLASNRVDIKTRFNLSRSLYLYLEAINVFNDKQREVWGVANRPRMILNRNDPQIHFGITGRL
jgi:iron complex outermembrane recepter protein